MAQKSNWTKNSKININDKNANKYVARYRGANGELNYDWDKEPSEAELNIANERAKSENFHTVHHHLVNNYYHGDYIKKLGTYDVKSEKYNKGENNEDKNEEKEINVNKSTDNHMETFNKLMNSGKWAGMTKEGNTITHSWTSKPEDSEKDIVTKVTGERFPNHQHTHVMAKYNKENYVKPFLEHYAETGKGNYKQSDMSKLWENSLKKHGLHNEWSGLSKEEQGNLYSELENDFWSNFSKQQLNKDENEEKKIAPQQMKVTVTHVNGNKVHMDAGEHGKHVGELHHMMTAAPKVGHTGTYDSGFGTFVNESEPHPNGGHYQYAFKRNGNYDAWKTHGNYDAEAAEKKSNDKNAEKKIDWNSASDEEKHNYVTGIRNSGKYNMFSEAHKFVPKEHMQNYYEGYIQGGWKKPKNNDENADKEIGTQFNKKQKGREIQYIAGNNKTEIYNSRKSNAVGNSVEDPDDTFYVVDIKNNNIVGKGKTREELDKILAKHKK